MKLKIKNLNKLIHDLSGREIDFYLYLIKRQNSIGCADGIYYKDVMDALHMPKSTFYAVLQELQIKNYIYLRDLGNATGFDIFIYDNSFLTEGDFKEGYVNINLDFILSEDFILLNVNLKKFFLRMLGLQANNKQVKILKDTLKQYSVYKLMDSLLRLFDITPDGNGYLFSIKTKLLKKSVNDVYLHYEGKLVNYCRTYSVNFTSTELRDSVRTIVNNIRKNKMALIHKAFDSIRKKGRLQPRLITHICHSKVY